MTRPRIAVTQWREFGDDEDSLDIRLAMDSDDVDSSIAEDHDLALEVDDSQPDQPGKYLGITSLTIVHGEELAYGQKRYRISIDEVTA